MLCKTLVFMHTKHWYIRFPLKYLVENTILSCFFLHKPLVLDFLLYILWKTLVLMHRSIGIRFHFVFSAENTVSNILKNSCNLLNSTLVVVELQLQPMYCSRDYNYSSRFNQQYEKTYTTVSNMFSSFCDILNNYC